MARAGRTESVVVERGLGGPEAHGASSVDAAPGAADNERMFPRFTTWLTASFSLTLAACSSTEEGASLAVSDPTEGWAAIGVEAGAASTDTQFLDIRSAAAFAEGHIAGARHLDVSELRATVDGIGGQAMPRSDADGVLSASGVDATRPIVVYGSQNDTSAGRALWSLAYYGSQSGLRLLDGGLAAWSDSGRELEVGPATVLSLPWAGGDTRSSLRVDKAWMLDHLDDPGVEVFDVRSVGEYEAGHIPGSVNVPWQENLNGDGSFRSADQVLRSHANPDSETLVVYCQSGARASVSWAVLSFAGLRDVRLYDGSWNEWGADSATPKVTGSSPR